MDTFLQPQHMYGNNSTGRPLVPFVEPAIHMDYGLGVYIGATIFVNRGCMILDTLVADVKIGEYCHIGPRVTLAAVGHPIQAENRRPVSHTGNRQPLTSFGRPFTVEGEVWVGAVVIISGSVTIGAMSVLGAGSVVLNSIPANSLAVRVPARVLRVLLCEQEKPLNTVVKTLDEALGNKFGTR